jgi:hypothetical protein
VERMAPMHRRRWTTLLQGIPAASAIRLRTSSGAASFPDS